MPDVQTSISLPKTQSSCQILWRALTTRTVPAGSLIRLVRKTLDSEYSHVFVTQFGGVWLGAWPGWRPSWLCLFAQGVEALKSRVRWGGPCILHGNDEKLRILIGVGHPPFLMVMYTARGCEKSSDEILGWFQREMYRVFILCRCVMTEEDSHVPNVIILKLRRTQILFDKFDIFI